MNRNQQSSNDIQQAAMASIAAASQTPFLTAFKIYMGFALAGLLTMTIALTGLTSFVFLLYWLLK
jgi:hypothetical protein